MANRGPERNPSAKPQSRATGFKTLPMPVTSRQSLLKMLTPVEKLTECRAPVAVFRLLFGAQFGECFLDLRKIK
jgi:hypothetical protein